MIQQGSLVCATETLTESDFMGKPRHCHAARGGVGRVIDVIDEEGEPVYVVRFARSGTVTDCYADQIRELRSANDLADTLRVQIADQGSEI